MRIIEGIAMNDANSSNLSKVGHDLASNTLQVEFYNKAVWQYHPVTDLAFRELMAAESQGKYFNANIKNNPQIEATQIK